MSNFAETSSLSPLCRAHILRAPFSGKMVGTLIGGGGGALGSQEQEPPKAAIADMSYTELLERKENVVTRLDEVAVKEVAPPNKRKGGANRAGGNASSSRKRPSPSARKTSASTKASDDQLDIVPFAPRLEVHWDYVMKEMMWLGTDFQAERKRQVSLAKKLASGIRQYHKTKESRRLRELAEAELKRRRLAGKISRELRGWWAKIERVVAYKQKLSADEERKKAMNKQLVALVKQTERYSESLMRQQDGDEHDGDDDGDMIDGMENGKRRTHKNLPNQYRRRLTIEEALASEKASVRNLKGRVTDYSRLRLEKGDDELYGESTASDSGSDASYAPESDFDDETTLAEAELDEIQERRKHQSNDRQDNTAKRQAFIADPEELRKLHEEGEMDIGRVIERLRNEAISSNQSDTEMTVNEEPDTSASAAVSKHVKFAPTLEISGNTKPALTQQPKPPKQSSFVQNSDAGNDADDDGDASDVEDFVVAMDRSGDSDDGSDEFEADETEVDDETTMAEEERLPKEMSAEDEISLLKKESEMSIEELRSLYANIEADNHSAEMGGEEQHLPLESSSNQNVATIETRERRKRQVDAARPTRGTRTTNRSSATAMQSNSSPALLRDLLADPGTSHNNEERDTEALAKAKNVDEDDEEFKPASKAELDDETTIEAEEKLGREMSHEDEMALLKSESEIPLDQLKAMYAAMGSGSDPHSEMDEDTDESSEKQKDGTLADMWAHASRPEADEDDYQPDETEVDDETTMAAEEALGRDMSYAEELDQLKRENEMSVEELRAMYENAKGQGVASHESDEREGLSMLQSESWGSELDGGDEFEPVGAEVDDETTIEAEEKLGRDMSVEDEIAALKQDCEVPVESLLQLYRRMEHDKDFLSSEGVPSSSKRKRNPNESDDEPTKKNRHDPDKEESDDGLAALNALEASAERARKTRASRPYIMANWVKLREYQQIGLNWLVSLQSRRLNGILADGKPPTALWNFAHFCCLLTLFSFATRNGSR